METKTDTLANANNIQLGKFDFKHAFRPVYCFSRFTGQWPFSIVYDSNTKVGKARVGFFGILWSILVICLNLTLALDGYEQLREEREKDVIHLRTLVGNIFGISSLLFIVIGMVLNIMNRHKFVNILRKLNTFDIKVSIK